MFKELLKIWQSSSLLKQASDVANEMFAENRKLVENSLNLLIENEKYEFDVYEEDRIINHFEKDIRRKILEHLTINPKQDVATSLVLLGVVRDIERIGDYAKNYYELNQIYDRKFKGEFADRLIDVKNKFIDLFSKTQKVFSEGDSSKAKEIMDFYYKELSPELNKITVDVMNSKNLDIQDAVAYTLLSRYLKRSAAHLANIASSVSNPFHKIGFRIRDNKEVEVRS